MMDSLFAILLLTGALAGSVQKKQAAAENAVAGLPEGEIKLEVNNQYELEKLVPVSVAVTVKPEK